MSTDFSPVEKTGKTEKQILNHQVVITGWGLLLILTGLVFLIPGWDIPTGVWLVGLGLIQLGANAFRYFNGIQVNAGSTVVGLLALGFGAVRLYGIDIPFLTLLLVLFGADLIFEVLLPKGERES